VEKERAIQEFRGWGPLKDTPIQAVYKNLLTQKEIKKKRRRENVVVGLLL
jgi:hypothetical protein